MGLRALDTQFIHFIKEEIQHEKVFTSDHFVL
jgi:hypothetical protein